jgi:hypothetical protein
MRTMHGWPESKIETCSSEFNAILKSLLILLWLIISSKISSVLLSLFLENKLQIFIFYFQQDYAVMPAARPEPCRLSISFNLTDKATS